MEINVEKKELCEKDSGSFAIEYIFSKGLEKWVMRTQVYKGSGFVNGFTNVLKIRDGSESCIIMQNYNKKTPPVRVARVTKKVMLDYAKNNFTEDYLQKCEQDVIKIISSGGDPSEQSE